MARPSKKINNSDNSEYIPGEDENDKKEESTSSNLQSILKENKALHFNFQERVVWKISTGSLTLDAAMGGGVSPSLLRICGPANEGKTPQTLEICRNFLNNVPNSKVFWMLAEGRGLSPENRERCGLNFVYSAQEWEKPGSVFVLESNIYELYIKCVKDLVLNNSSGYRYMFVCDSLDGMQLETEKNKEISENVKICGAPAISKRMMQSLSLGMFKYGHCMVLISQVTSEVKIDPYAKTANRGGNFSGGNCLLHASDFILEVESSYNGDYILDNSKGKLNDGKSKPIGKWAKIIVQKSALEVSRKQRVSYPIKFGSKPSGVWKALEIAEIMIAFKLATSAMAWINIEPSLVAELKEKNLPMEDKFQGQDNFRKFLEEHTNTCDYLFEKLKNILSN